MATDWTPKNIEQWVMWAAYRLAARGTVDPKNTELESILWEDDRVFELSQIRKAKNSLFEKYSNWEGVRREVERLRSGDTTGELVERLAAQYSSEEARQLAVSIDRKPFVGHLVDLLNLPGVGSFRAGDIKSVFTPKSFPTATPPFDRWYEEIHRLFDETAAGEIDGFIARQDGQQLGYRNLRPYLRSIQLHPSDHHGLSRLSGILPLQLTFGPCDWYSVEAFNNRMIEDTAFRNRAHENGWVRRALPPASGKAPGYVCTHIIVTGPDYLLLTQRLGKKTVRYYPSRWSITLEENMQGPREVTRQGLEEYEPGDVSIHACALRGLEEELGVRPADIDDIELLGLFGEAPLAGVAAVLWVRLLIPWRLLSARMGQAYDPEARAVACEPLNTANLVQLWFQENYTPRRGEGRDYFVPMEQPPSQRPFHPTARGRLLSYLLADRNRHPASEVIAEFNQRLDGAAPR